MTTRGFDGGSTVTIDYSRTTADSAKASFDPGSGWTLEKTRRCGPVTAGSARRRFKAPTSTNIESGSNGRGLDQLHR